MLLDASGHSMVYVNGEPRYGDPYRTGFSRLPIELRRGTNTLLFSCGRGAVRARLVEPKASVSLNLADATAPDLITGERVNDWIGIVVVNATRDAQDELRIRTSYSGGQTVATRVPAIEPLSIRKIPVRVRGVARRSAGEIKLRIELLSGKKKDKPTDSAEISLAVRDPLEKHKRTFISEIDGSVQYYGVTPMHGELPDGERPALFLTLHGAGVEGIGQARAYAFKDWGYIVAPTNRRPFGFDWEDWGRWDAIEVLDLASERLGIDPQRTFLTGHSMGGHGTWHVGVTLPDRFAAIAPSAGWISFWSYAGAEKFENATALEKILKRATSPSDTLALSRNLLQFGVYILHGDRDDNVPVEQARTMRARLGEFHGDFAYYERPGAGHWWGNACVDWPPLFDFLRAHRRRQPHEVRDIEFATASPAVSSQSDWLTIEAQVHPLEVSTVKLHFDPEKRTFEGVTDNVARLSIDLAELSRKRTRVAEEKTVDATLLPAGAPLTVVLDEQRLEDLPWPTDEPRLWLERSADRWVRASRPADSQKSPLRQGPFKQVLRNHFVLVYATRGDARENAWARAKARFDAESFWYRGNGVADVCADVDFDPQKEHERNVILYGNAQTNAAWDALLSDSPVQVGAGSVSIGTREFHGDDLACLFVRPRPGSNHALVGVVAGSGTTGMRLTDRLPYFVSGVAYPDCTVLSAGALRTGTAGVRAAGFFGNDWSIESGEFAWSE